MPVTAMTFAERHWTHGWVMCKLYAYFKFALSSSSLSTVLVISINRYVIVCHPHLYPRLYNTRTIYKSILLIWASSLAIFVAPFFKVLGRFDLEPHEGFCTMLPDLNGRAPKKFLIVFFVLPYLTIVLCYARIWYVVQTSKKILSKNLRSTLPLPQAQSSIATNRNSPMNCEFSRPGSSSTTKSDKTLNTMNTSAPQSPKYERAFEKYFKAPFRFTRKLDGQKVPTSRDKRLCAMIVAIMLSYCISHLPLIVVRLAYKEFETEPVLYVLSHLLLFPGTCINPIIYVLMSREYRQAYHSLFEAIIK